MSKVQCCKCWKFVEASKVVWFRVARDEMAHCPDCDREYRERKGK